MSKREQALNMVRTMPESKLTELLEFLRILWEASEIPNAGTLTASAEIPNAGTLTASAEIPNAETIAAMEETDEMIRTGGGQRFTGSTADFFAMLDAEE